MAIVGARKYTTYGAEVAHQAAYTLAQKGVIIVSGLAYGIDSVAHRAALAAGGVTVAVLGTAIDQIYPRRHVGLAQEIVAQHGVVMSEYGEGAPFYRANFLARNRLIAGLADVVLVVEAGERSGSLNTATHALEQGKTVYAVPGDITRPTSVGCNRLLVAGASVYTGVDDLLRELWPAEYLTWRRAKRQQGQLALCGDDALETVILRLLAEGVQDGDALLAHLREAQTDGVDGQTTAEVYGMDGQTATKAHGVEIAEFHSALTRLEMKGRIWALGMNRWGLM